MWLVSGIDEEHRFPEWADAARFYRQIVEDWVAANGGTGRERAQALDELQPGDSQQIELAVEGGHGEKARFGLVWEVAGGRTDQFVAC